MMKKVLLIEDEPQIARFVQLELQHEGYDVTLAYDGRVGLEVFKASSFDVVLLDIMLPSLNGIEVLRRIRFTSTVPIIMLTARDSVMDKVSGLDNGAYDYITKPFAIEELLARLRSVLRKHSVPTLLSFKALTLDVDQHECFVQKEKIELTKKEFELLHLLLINKNKVLTREVLLEKIWGYEFDGTTNVVDVYIRYLRSKIEDPFNLKFIHTVRGIGYIIKDEVEPHE
ncbi:MAG: response regulator transcription factor [Erysipelotrichaceae bacterium]|nr:response regulator transcription factor [Erysipelotrichaceae bacterium]